MLRQFESSQGECAPGGLRPSAELCWCSHAWALLLLPAGPPVGVQYIKLILQCSRLFQQHWLQKMASCQTLLQFAALCIKMS